MCGVTGAWSFGGARRDDLRATVSRMTASLQHRGPDDEGVWLDEAAGIGLGFRRLAILDLSSAGHQPMHSADGRYTVVFNGEVYNYRELRAELAGEGHQFRGTSDTEVVAEAMAAWGVSAAVPRLWGMFAIGVWDHASRTLTLARDRVGKKPLYYRADAAELLFGSELKALAAARPGTFSIARDALAAYFRFGYVPSPHSIYQHTWKVPPGTLLTFAPGREPHAFQYWDARSVARDGLNTRLQSSEREAVDDLEGLLADAVDRRMIADVPVGALLSGGIDSSAVVALCQARRSKPINTFTVGFHERSYDEAEPARRIAQHLGTDHTELYLTPERLLEVVPRLPAIYDEPLSDPSQIPTLLVYEAARRHVTVALSGDGGDELFGGYSRYAWAAQVWNLVRAMPALLHRPVAGAIRRMPVRAWDRMYSHVSPIVPRAWRVTLLGDKLHKFSALMAAGHPDGLYHRLISLWNQPEQLVRGARELRTVIGDPGVRGIVGDFTERMMLLDTLTYLPDDILVKVDRASMAVSLESRAPLLDHRLIEWSWRLPVHLKTQGGGKWLLKQLVYRYIPREMVDRPKMGFGVPIDSWLRGALRPWAEALLDEGRLKREGLLDPAPIRAAWLNHLSGAASAPYQLWAVLMFQAWREAWDAA
jgi:asparagine synthase (glutamine-hydrolysing)